MNDLHLQKTESLILLLGEIKKDRFSGFDNEKALLRRDIIEILYRRRG